MIVYFAVAVTSVLSFSNTVEQKEIKIRSKNTHVPGISANRLKLYRAVTYFNF